MVTIILIIFFNFSLVFGASQTDLIPKNPELEANYKKFCSNYNKKVESAMKEVNPKLQEIHALTGIVNEYASCISYDEWYKNGQALIRAVADNNFAKIKNLAALSHVVDINAQSPEFGWTPLIWYASQPSSYINNVMFEFFLSKENVDINAKDKKKYTAFIWACRNGNVPIIKLLLDRKDLEINAKDHNEYTALIWAAVNGFAEIVKLLLKNENIDVNIQDKFGSTALMRATDKGNIEIVKLLLEKGANPNFEEKKGMTALKVAQNKNHKNIIKLLKEKGATR